MVREIRNKSDTPSTLLPNPLGLIWSGLKFVALPVLESALLVERSPEKDSIWLRTNSERKLTGFMPIMLYSKITALELCKKYELDVAENPLSIRLEDWISAEENYVGLASLNADDLLEKNITLKQHNNLLTFALFKLNLASKNLLNYTIDTCLKQTQKNTPERNCTNYPGYDLDFLVVQLSNLAAMRDRLQTRMHHLTLSKT